MAWQASPGVAPHGGVWTGGASLTDRCAKPGGLSRLARITARQAALGADWQGQTWRVGAGEGRLANACLGGSGPTTLGAVCRLKERHGLAGISRHGGVRPGRDRPLEAWPVMAGDGRGLLIEAPPFLLLVEDDARSSPSRPPNRCRPS